MTDEERKEQPGAYVDPRLEYEERTRTATAEDLADGIPTTWEPSSTQQHIRILDVTARTNAFLWLRLTEKLERAAAALADASNSGTRTMARLTVVYVALTGVLAVTAIVGAAATVYSALKTCGMPVALVAGGLSTIVLVLTSVAIAKLWPKE